MIKNWRNCVSVWNKGGHKIFYEVLTFYFCFADVSIFRLASEAGKRCQPASTPHADGLTLKGKDSQKVWEWGPYSLTLGYHMKDFL